MRLSPLLLATVLAALPACADPEPAAPPVEAPAPLPPPPPPEAGPGVDTISVEGEPMAMDVVPYETPMGFPVPFSTRLPADFEAESVASGEGDAVRFAPADTEEVLLHVFVPADASMGEAGAAEIAAAQGASVRIDGPVWARASFRSDAGATSVVVHLVRHADRPVLLTTSYPAEYGDGLAPRMSYVIDRIRWTDTGRLLIDG